MLQQQSEIISFQLKENLPLEIDKLLRLIDLNNNTKFDQEEIKKEEKVQIKQENISERYEKLKNRTEALSKQV
jgi:hypothetical protein